MAKKHYKSIFSFINEYEKPEKKKNLNPPTEAQLIQRDKFATAKRFVGHIHEMINIGFSQKKLPNMSIRNYVTQEILASAMIGEYPDCEIDYSKVRLSDGRLDYVLVFYSAIDDKGSLKLIWEVYDNLGGLRSAPSGDDQVFVFVYNETKGMSYSFKNAAERADLEVSLQIPRYDIHDVIHTWMFIRSKDEKRISLTGYYGNLDDFC